MQEKRTENHTMRALYLMAILFVVDGHIPLGEMLGFGGLFRYYSFHLMLFAFGSGYFFSREGCLAQRIGKSAKRLLVPLYAWNLFYGLLAALLRRFFHAELGEPLSVYTLLLAPVVDGEHFAYNLGAWYVFALFGVKVIYSLLDRLFERVRYREVVLTVLTLALGAAAVEVCRAGNSGGIPVFLLRMAILLPGYALGVLYRAKLETRDVLPTLPYLTGIVVLRALLCVRYDNLAYLLSNCTYFGCDAFGVYAGALLAIAFYLRVARLLAPIVQRSRAALYVSRHTFDIMMHHYMGFFVLNGFFLVLNALGIGAADFSVRSLRTVSGYVYSPGGRAEWAVLYLLAGIGFSCAAAWATERIGRIVKHKK